MYNIENIYGIIYFMIAAGGQKFVPIDLQHGVRVREG